MVQLQTWTIQEVEITCHETIPRPLDRNSIALYVQRPYTEAQTSLNIWLLSAVAALCPTFSLGHFFRLVMGLLLVLSFLLVCVCVCVCVRACVCPTTHSLAGSTSSPPPLRAVLLSLVSVMMSLTVPTSSSLVQSGSSTVFVLKREVRNRWQNAHGD